jgi:predicted metalloprotease with PDZ domain
MKASVHVRLIVVCCLLCGGAAFAQSESHHYGLRYDLTLIPAEDRAEVSLTLDRRVKGNIWSMRFHIDPQRHAGFQGDGVIEPDGAYVTWHPPETGGRLSFHVPVSSRRANGRFDARMTEDWAIFRGDDLFPPAHNQDNDVAEADATLHVHLPEGWSFATAYPRVGDHVYEIEHAHRRFDRPTGWMAAGRLGVRRELIARTRVIVAGPLNQGVRRLDMLALLNWNLPRLRRVFPEMPERILVVSAGDPMWRGGLSGPNSLFIHADRPLLSENGSSTLIHELVHVANRLEGEQGADWIIEGIAEYYCLKILWRSGTLTDHRYQATFRKYEKWGLDADRLDADLSRGPITARAVGIMRKLDREIYRKTDHKKSLDEVVRLLAAARQKVSLDRLRQAVVEVMGEPADALSNRQLGLGADG